MYSIYVSDHHRQLDLSYHMIHQDVVLAKLNARCLKKDKSKKMFRGTIDFKRF